MQKRTIAALAAASGLLLAAGTAAAVADEDEPGAAKACAGRDYVKVNVSPPPPRTVQAEDVGKLLDTLAEGKVPRTVPDSPEDPESREKGTKECAKYTVTLGPDDAMRLVKVIFGD